MKQRRANSTGHGAGCFGSRLIYGTVQAFMAREAHEMNQKAVPGDGPE
jgi:hypothetical protein